MSKWIQTVREWLVSSFKMPFISVLGIKSVAELLMLMCRCLLLLNFHELNCLGSWYPEEELYHKNSEEVGEKMDLYVNITSDCQPFVDSSFDQIDHG